MVVLGMMWMTAWSTAATPATTKVERSIGKLKWHTEYSAAYTEAAKNKKQLLLFFTDRQNPSTQMEERVLNDSELTPVLNRYVRAILPMDATVPAKSKTEIGKKLLDLPAFAEMYRSPGLAIVDLVDSKEAFHGHVVSAHTISEAYWIPTSLCKVILELPRGTITQRALTFAVRTHPEAPQSAWGAAHPFLMYKAHEHSQMMVQYGSVGHHDWGNRSSEVMSQVGGSPSEVAASAGGDRVLDAAREAVEMWRGSGTHWGMVSSGHSHFGYDMVRSPGGGWYATGIFAN